MAVKHLVGALPLVITFCSFSLAATGPTITAGHALSASSASLTPPIRSHPTSLPHVSYSGTPTTTGALSHSSVGSGIRSLPPRPEATTYPSDGKLHDPEPAPYVPAGGLGTNGTTPIYNVKSDFDYESLVCSHGDPTLRAGLLPNVCS
jgi:hypothetical protein